MQKNIRRASPLYECSDSETEIEEEEEETCDTAYRLKRAQNQKQNGPNSTSTEEIEHKNKEIKNSETSNQNDNQNKEVIQQLLDRIKVLETQIQGVDSKSEPRKPIVCYNCNQPGHISRNCLAPRSNFNRNANNYSRQSQGQNRNSLNYMGQPQMANSEPFSSKANDNQ